MSTKIENNYYFDLYLIKVNNKYIFDTIDHDILLAKLFMVSEELPSIGSKVIYSIASNMSATMVVNRIN